jgi:hypothetical protein
METLEYLRLTPKLLAGFGPLDAPRKTFVQTFDDD